MIFCVSALTCISYLQTFVQPQSVLLNETFLLSFWRCSGFMFLSHPHFWPNSWRPYLFFSCQSRPNLSAKMKHTGITQHCLFSYIFSQVWVVCVLFCGCFFSFHLVFEFYKGDFRRIYQTTLAKSHDNAFQLYPAEQPNLQMFFLTQIFSEKFSFHILLDFCKCICKERDQSSLEIRWSKRPVGPLAESQPHLEIKLFQR